jgi:hypothetical protein
VADQPVENYALHSSNNTWSAVWQMTRAFKAAGGKYKASSDGSSKDTSGVSANDKWGGGGSPLADTYPSALDAVQCWWVGEGCPTLKVSMTAAPTGTFTRGEKVTQATSGAEGEILGLDFDGVSTGHAVIIPRTGTFDGTHVITGASSGATLTATAVDTFAMQLCICKKNDLVNGLIMIQRCSVTNESASQFSALAASAGCTATNPPGGGGTSNALPTAGTYVARGEQNAGTITFDTWFYESTNFVTAQMAVMNLTGAAGVSPDGTFWCGVGNTANSTQFNFWGYFRCDNSEPGDLDPFGFFMPSNVAKNDAAGARVNATGQNTTHGSAVASWFFGTTAVGGGFTWRGWRRRGFASGDAFVPLMITWLNGYGSGNGTAMMGDNTANPETIACSYTTQYLREQMTLVSADSTAKIRKGVPRWAFHIQKGTTFDTADGKLKIGAIAPGASQGTVYLGKGDGTTTPIQ